MSDQRDGGIAWTDQTWNPTRGCKAISPGCANCYAATMAARFSDTGQPYEGLARRGAGKALAQWTGKGRFVRDHLADPLRWTRPRRVFVNSMSDLFFEEFTNQQIAAVFGVMAASPRHTFQVLTKRPERMLEWFGSLPSEPWHANEFVKVAARAFGISRDQLHTPAAEWPLPNVWLGVSAEDQKRADERIPLLLSAPAAVRFISAEPLIGQLDLDRFLWKRNFDERGASDDVCLDWVIVGGESGHRARPCCLSWIRNIVHDCEEAGVACFVKQLGSRPYEPVDDAPDEEDEWAVGEWVETKHSKGGDPSEWGSYMRVQQFPGASP